MNWINHRYQTWLASRELEHERKAVLSRTVQNDPKLVEPTRVRVLRPFCTEGQRREIGETVTVDRTTAESLQAIGKAEILK